MQLQPNETTILTADKNQVILTDLRICGDFKDGGNAQKTFIYLEDISSIQIVFRNYVMIMWLGILVLGYGLFLIIQGDPDERGIASLILGMAFIIGWYVTRKRVISIYPNGGLPLEISTNLMDEQVINNFIEKLQLAKTERLKLLYKI